MDLGDDSGSRLVNSVLEFDSMNLRVKLVVSDHQGSHWRTAKVKVKEIHDESNILLWRCEVDLYQHTSRTS